MSAETAATPLEQLLAWFQRHETKLPKGAVDAFYELATQYGVMREHLEYYRREALKREDELKAARAALLDLDAGGHSDATEAALRAARAAVVGPVIPVWKGFR